MRRKINGVEYIPAAWAEESARDHDTLVRELDVLLNGEAGAAKQAMLCDIVAQMRGMRDGDTDDQAVHKWFGLSYASFLVLPRVLMEAMPADWQSDMTALLEQIGNRFHTNPIGDKFYMVKVGETPWPEEDDDGNPRDIKLEDPDDALCNYRRPNIKHLYK